VVWVNVTEHQSETLPELLERFEKWPRELTHLMETAYGFEPTTTLMLNSVLSCGHRDPEAPAPLFKTLRGMYLNNYATMLTRRDPEVTDHVFYEYLYLPNMEAQGAWVLTFKAIAEVHRDILTPQGYQSLIEPWEVVLQAQTRFNDNPRELALFLEMLPCWSGSLTSLLDAVFDVAARTPLHR
jgi:hypothetical protein